MDVYVHFLGFQRAVTCTENIKVPLAGGMRVADVLHYVGERFPQLALDQENVSVTVNNDVSAKERILQSDDTISFFPHIGGG